MKQNNNNDNNNGNSLVVKKYDDFNNIYTISMSVQNRAGKIGLEECVAFSTCLGKKQTNFFLTNNGN